MKAYFSCNRICQFSLSSFAVAYVDRLLKYKKTPGFIIYFFDWLCRTFCLSFSGYCSAFFLVKAAELLVKLPDALERDKVCRVGESLRQGSKKAPFGRGVNSCKTYIDVLAILKKVSASNQDAALDPRDHHVGVFQPLLDGSFRDKCQTKSITFLPDPADNRLSDRSGRNLACLQNVPYINFIQLLDKAEMYLARQLSILYTEDTYTKLKQASLLAFFKLN
jgi:hypothetical protein